MQFAKPLARRNDACIGVDSQQRRRSNRQMPHRRNFTVDLAVSVCQSAECERLGFFFTETGREDKGGIVVRRRDGDGTTRMAGGAPVRSARRTEHGRRSRRFDLVVRISIGWVVDFDFLHTHTTHVWSVYHTRSPFSRAFGGLAAHLAFVLALLFWRMKQRAWTTRRRTRWPCSRRQ